MFSKPLILLALVLVPCAMATTFHVNSGCIRINGEAVCKGSRSLGSSAKVEAKYSGSRDRDKDKVGCVKNFKWPAGYGDVYYGADNCLYDSKRNNIDGQCCTGGGGYETKNPYRW